MKKIKKILVTGGCGFIGTNFIDNQLKKGNCHILNIDSLTYAANSDDFTNYSKLQNYSFLRGDIADQNFVKRVFTEFSPQILVNFAAETHVDRSIDSPHKFIKTNMLGTYNLLDVSLSYFQSGNSILFIHISTDEVFGSLELSEKAFDEYSPYKPSSPYSASKAGSDHLVKAWNTTYQLPTIITNCSNNYGPFQFPEKLIPLVIANCIDEKPLPIYGDGSNIRDWLYVSDHCDALDLIICDGKIGENYNIGGNNEIKNIEIVRTICQTLDDIKPRKNGSYKDLITFVKDRPGHDLRYSVNSSKLRNNLHWKPKESLNSGLKKTIKWYISNEAWWRNIQKETYQQQRLGTKSS